MYVEITWGVITLLVGSLMLSGPTSTGNNSRVIALTRVTSSAIKNKFNDFEVDPGTQQAYL